MTFLGTAGHKSPPDLNRVTTAIAKLVVCMREGIRKLVPVGYQDEGGFHYGLKPSERKMSWPLVWQLGSGV
jgi:hypothetical protein